MRRGRWSVLNTEQLLTVLDALGHIQRLRILALLRVERVHVSELARRLELSRPLVTMHLKRLENAGLIVGKLEMSPDGKAMKFYEFAPFDIRLTPDTVLAALQEDSEANARSSESGEPTE